MTDRKYPLVKQWNGRYWEWLETHPDSCANGHDWTQPETMRPGWHEGHRVWSCATKGCDAPDIVKDD